jgi:hypothetical protein
MTPMRAATVTSLLVGLGLSIVEPAGADVVPYSCPTRVARETGAGSVSATDTRWTVAGTDLGIPWDDGTGRLLIAFGDTVSNPSGAGGGPGGGDWRRGGTLATSSDFWPYDGVAFSSMVTDTPGHATNAITPASSPGVDYNCIPTAGASIDGIDFLHFFSVESWCTQGLQTYRSGLAYRSSGSNGPFTRLPSGDVNWGPASNFGWAALIARGEYLYMFGTPPSRVGGVKLARAHGAFAAGYGGWEYWDGATWQWNESQAAFIVPPPVSELSVQFDPNYGRYLMTYLDPSRNGGSSQVGALVERDAPSLEGPWTEEKEILTNAEYPGEYGGFVYPFSVGGSAFGTQTEIFFNLSEWGPYNVSLFHTTLSWRAQDDNVLTDGGFEDQIVGGVNLPWALGGGSGGIDIRIGNAHSGGNNAWLRASDVNWHDLHQTVAVNPNADYLLTFWVRSYNVTAGYAGVRTGEVPVAANGVDYCGGATTVADSNTFLQQTTFGTLASYQQVSVRFNAGARSLADVFIGFWGNGSDGWAQIDDVTLVPLQTIHDGGFEMQPTAGVSWPYDVEGSGAKGIDRQLGLSHGGENNAWINTTDSSEWNAITQALTVDPYTWYHLTGWVQTSSPFGAGYFGVRDGSGTIIDETSFGASTSYAQLSVWFYSGANTTARAYTGYWTPSGGVDTWMRIDDLSLERE